MHVYGSEKSWKTAVTVLYAPYIVGRVGTVSQEIMSARLDGLVSAFDYH